VARISYRVIFVVRTTAIYIAVRFSFVVCFNYLHSFIIQSFQSIDICASVKG